MPRFGGGHEDFEKEIAELRALKSEREKLAASEAASTRQLTSAAAAEKTAADMSRVRAGAKREGAEVDERAARAVKATTKATEMDTAAVKANTAARERANRTRAWGERAVYGARSPQYRQAYGLYQETGQIPSQYRLRQIEGVGQRRAAAMVQAMQAGLVPSQGGDYSRPLRRLDAAHEALAAQQYRLAQATKDYERVLRSGTEDEAQKAYATKQAAKTAQDAARQEIKDAETAHTAAVARINAERQDRARMQAERLRQVRETPLIPGQLALPAAGQSSATLPLGVYRRAQTQTAVPFGQRALPPAGGTTQGMPVQNAEVRTMRVQRLALPPAGGTTQGMPLHLAQTRTAVPIPGGGPGGGGPPPPGPNWAAGSPAMQRYLAAAQRAQAVIDSQAAAQERITRANVAAGASFYPLSQQMHRHGALTSEFIAAAARGETTLRELGRQATITAGKFAGWTVAAAAVYGVAGALAQVGKGAMAASSGAEQAYRVITTDKDRDRLQGSFAGLSKQFNVPIETAADAVYRMGQVFHSQTDAVEAAQAALLSYKTGEVSVEDSTKNLIAIQRGFGLSSKELVAIFDQINAAQNIFGVSIGNVEQGLARAGGTWRNAGGDLSYLLAIMVAVQKATGESGATIGTALSRLYYVQHPGSAEKLRDLGVDVDVRNAQSTFESLLKKAREPGADIQALASGFFGNQYARLFTGMLRDQRTFNDALEKTSGTAAKGSGYKELQRVLKQVDEQIDQLGNGLQRLGVALGQAGAFKIFGVLLQGLNKALDLTTALVNLFNIIPNPLRSAVVLMGEIVLLMTLMRRLGATERLANSRLGFLADPVGRQRVHTIAGLRQGQTEAFNRVERAGTRAYDAAFRAGVDRQLANQAGAAYRRAQHLDPSDPKRIALHNRLMLAEQKALESETALTIANRELAAARAAAAAMEKELTAAQATTRRTFMATAAARGWTYPRQLDQPNLAGTAGPGGTVIIPPRGPGGTVPAGQYRPPAVPLRGPGGTVPAGAWVPPMGPGGSVPAGSASGAAATARAVRAATTAQQAIIAELKATEAAMRFMGTTGLLLGRTATRTAAVGRAAATGLGRAAVGLRSAGAALASLGAMLGPLDILILALIGGMILKSKVDKLQANTDKVRRSIQGPTRTQGAVKAQQEAVDDVLDTQFKAMQASGVGPGARQQSAWQYVKGGGFMASVKAMWNDFTGVTEAAEAAREEYRQRLELQARAMKENKPRPLLTEDELIKSVEETADLRQRGLISQREFDERMAKHAIEAKHMLDATKQSVDNARRAIADAQRAQHGQDYFKSLVDMPNDEFAKEMQGQAAAVQLFGLTAHNLDYLKKQYQAAEQKYRNNPTPDALIALNNARQAYFGAINEEVQKELQLGLLQATNEYERRAAFERAEAEYDRARITMQQQNSRMREGFKKQREEQARKQKQEDRGGFRHQRMIGDDSPQGGDYRPTDDQVQEREDRQRRERIKLTREQKRKMNKELERQNRELTLAQLQLKQQAYDDRAQGRQILLNLQIAGTQDPMRQAVLRVDTAKRQVADAEREWGTNSRQYRQALTDLRSAQVQQAQAVVAGVEADNAILLAQAGGDPVREARVAAQNAQRVLDTMLANRGKFDPNAIKQQRANVINQNRAAKDAQDQQAQDLARLRGELATAQAGGDPVAAARAAVEAANLARQVADTPTERLQALVDWTNANNQLQDALVEREQMRTDLLISRTDDPVKQAKLRRDAAAKALAGAKGYKRMEAEIQYNDANRAYQDALISDKEDTIRFQLGMDQITADVAADQLEALANMKGISKQKKRDLLLQAKQLRDGAASDYELDVGDIRLPSIYEIRRLAKTGKPTAAGSVVNDSRSFTVYLANGEAVRAFASELELTNGTAAKATSRSMMMR